MHLDKQKPRFQIRLLEYDKDGMTFKKGGSKSSNIYPNSDDLSLEQLWKQIGDAIEKRKK